MPRLCSWLGGYKEKEKLECNIEHTLPALNMDQNTLSGWANNYLSIAHSFQRIPEMNWLPLKNSLSLLVDSSHLKVLSFYNSNLLCSEYKTPSKNLPCCGLVKADKKTLGEKPNSVGHWLGKHRAESHQTWVYPDPSSLLCGLGQVIYPVWISFSLSY